MKKLIITGAGGFLGQQLLRSSNAFSCEIFALTSQKNLLEKEFRDRPYIHFYVPDNLEKIPWDHEAVLINCAFPRQSDGIMLGEGLLYTERLLQTAINRGVGAVINISSQSVYSQKRTTAASESSQINLESAYAVGKYASELMTNAICKLIPHSNIRLSSLIGVGFDQRIVNKLIHQSLRGKTLEIITGDIVFSFMDVRDAANAILTMGVSDYSNWKTEYNLGTRECYSIVELVRYICQVMEEDTQLFPKVIYREGNDHSNTSLLVDRFEHDFKWSPQYGIRDSIKSILNAAIAG